MKKILKAILIGLLTLALELVRQMSVGIAR